MSPLRVSIALSVPSVSGAFNSIRGQTSLRVAGYPPRNDPDGIYRLRASPRSLFKMFE